MLICTSIQYTINDFNIILSNDDNYQLDIYYQDQPNYPVFSLSKYQHSKPFISLSQAILLEPPISDGNFKHFEYNQQYLINSNDVSSLTSTQNTATKCITFNGTILFYSSHHYNTAFSLIICPPEPTEPYYNNNTKLTSQYSLDIQISLLNNTNTFNRIFLLYNSDINESFWGFGVQYSFINFKGKRLPIYITEQGVGRGLEPLTTSINIAENGAGGDWHTSYATKPLYMTNRNRSFILKNSEISVFNLIPLDYVEMEVYVNNTDSIEFRIIYQNNPLDMISEITQYTGRMYPLPEWILQGGIMGIEGGQDYVMNKTLEMLDAGVNLIGIWIQDWVGNHTSSEDGTRLLWNWELNTLQYPNWNEMVNVLGSKGVRILSYVNPYFTNVTQIAPEQSKGFRNIYYDEGIQKGYFVKNSTNQAYLIGTFSFQFATLDLTNNEAIEWFKNTIIKQNMILDTNISGFMADFCEYLPFDSVLFNGNASNWHNEYTVAFQKIVRDAITELNMDNLVIPFHRSGFTLSPKYARSFWLGDQLVTWDSHDGIKSVLYGYFNGAISGDNMVHSDIGGYTMLDESIFTYLRSCELLMRWIELNSFIDMIYRSHPGNIPQKSCQIYSNSDVTQHFIKFSNIFKLLSQYKLELMNNATNYGYPIIRHLYFNYPNDMTILNVMNRKKTFDDDIIKDDSYHIINEEFMLGDCLLMKPILSPNISTTDIYIPNGKWINYWNSNDIINSNGNVYKNINAPMGEPPVYVCNSWPYFLGNGQHVS